jgi:serum/glucocorticoid-regulated kinase 2
VFSQLFKHGVDLNVRILDYDETINRPTPEGIVYKPDILNLIPVTPLKWAVEHERLDLVNLFLKNGADANFTVSPRHWPALVKAVKCKSQELVKILMHKMDRTSCTRALGWAVEQGDLTTANTLLANGVCCDFEEADRPPPLHPFHNDNYSLI